MRLQREMLLLCPYLEKRNFWFPIRKSFSFSNSIYFSTFLLFYLWLVSKIVKLPHYWEFAVYCFFAGLRCMYKNILVYTQVFIPGWIYSCLKKTRSIHMKMSVNHTSQWIIKPIAGPWWMFTNDSRGTKLSGTGQERPTQGCQQPALNSPRDKAAF